MKTFTWSPIMLIITALNEIISSGSPEFRFHDLEDTSASSLQSCQEQIEEIKIQTDWK